MAKKPPSGAFYILLLASDDHERLALYIKNSLLFHITRTKVRYIKNAMRCIFLLAVVIVGDDVRTGIPVPISSLFYRIPLRLRTAIFYA